MRSDDIAALALDLASCAEALRRAGCAQHRSNVILEANKAFNAATTVLATEDDLAGYIEREREAATARSPWTHRGDAR